jgi:predicted nucleic acid-binding Zn ribbon protein
MSFITFDYSCPNCNEFAPDTFVRRSEQDKVHCGKCGALMRKLIPPPKTTFRFADGPKKEARDKPKQPEAEKPVTLTIQGD